MESGTGFLFESQGGRAFVGFFMYDELSGNPIWYVAYGDLVAGAAGEFRFTADLRAYSGGKPISSSTYTSSTPSSTSVGQVEIDFAGGKANVKLPGGRIMVAQRFVIDGSGFDHANPASRRSHQPETGWYWNPDEGGRGYAVEVQNDKIFMAVFHYNLDGSPTWNVVQGDIPSGTTVKPLELYTGGQTLTSAHRWGSRDELAPFTMSFRTACAGQLQLAGAPPITIRRFFIDGSTQPKGAECVELGQLADVPDINTTTTEVAPGDTVFGNIDGVGDVDGYRIALVAGTTYTFEVLGAYSGNGTLADPSMALFAHNLAFLTENDNRDATSTDSRVTYTATTTGNHFVRVRAGGDGSGTGRFALRASGVAPAILPQGQPPSASSFAGSVSGQLKGPRPGSINLTVAPNGAISGTLSYSGAQVQTSTVTGQLASGGIASFTAGAVHCTAFVSGGVLSGGCGPAGMVAGKLAQNTTGVGYVARNGMTVTLMGFTSTVLGNGYTRYVAQYKEQNNTAFAIDQASLKLYFADGTAMNQFGFFNSVLPGAFFATVRSYTFDAPSSSVPSVLQYDPDHFFASAPLPGALKWALPLVVPSSIQLYETGLAGNETLQALPFSSVAAASGSSICVGTGCPTDYTVATFRLMANGRSYTVANLSAVNETTGSAVVPSFGGLASNQVINAGTSASFQLKSAFTRNSTVNLRYQFTILETGQTFNYSVQLRTN